MIKKTILLISTFCFLTTFSVAQKTVRKRLKLKTSPRVSDQTNSPSSVSNEKKSRQSNSPLIILDKPRPEFFTDGQDCLQGKVVLRVTFLETGEIGMIYIISGLSKNKTESAIEAAKKIKFEPATKDGKPVTASKLVEYSFTIY